MVALLRVLWNFLKSLAPWISSMIATVGLTIGLTSYANSKMAGVMSAIDSFVFESVLDFSPLNLLNYVFPFDTLLSFIVLYMNLTLVCAVVRIARAHAQVRS